MVGQEGGGSGRGKRRLLMLVTVLAVLAGACETTRKPIAVAGMASSDGPQSLAEIGLVETAAPATTAETAGTALAELAPPADTVPAKSASTTETANEGTPVGKDWVFVEIDGFAGKLPGVTPYPGFILTTEASRMTGSTSCNRMMSSFSIDPAAGTLRFTNVVNTRMMCQLAFADIEEAVLEVMLATAGFRLVQGRLELLSKGKVLARLITN
jgi:heat shock protein HslJ